MKQKKIIFEKKKSKIIWVPLQFFWKCTWLFSVPLAQVGLVELIDAKGIDVAKDSYRNGQNTPPLIFENLKPVEIIKKSFEHHLNILKFV